MANNSRLSKLRQITKSVTGGLPSAIRDDAEDFLARAATGVESLWTTIDPKTGEVRSILPPFFSQEEPILPSASKGTLPGIAYDTASLGNFLPGEHKWAQEASDKADAIKAQAMQENQLSPARNFTQESAEMLGTMLGQVPIPGGVLRRAQALKELGPATRSRKLMDLAKRTASAPAEYLGPTIEPSISNYAHGTLGGLGLNHLIDAVVGQPLSPEIEEAHRDLADRYLKSGTLTPGYSKGGRVAKPVLDHMKNLLNTGRQFPEAAKAAADKFGVDASDVLDAAKKAGMAPDPLFLAKGGVVTPLLSAVRKRSFHDDVINHLNRLYEVHGPLPAEEHHITIGTDAEGNPDVQTGVTKRLLIDPSDKAGSIFEEMQRIHKTDPEVLKSNPIPDFWEGDTLGDQLRRLSKYFEEDHAHAFED